MSDYFDQLASTWDQDPMKVERSVATAHQCKQVAEKAGRHLLDFGGGTGLLSVCLADVFEQITIADTSREMLRMAEEKISKATIKNISTQFINKDISEITNTYSAMVMLMTLHHIADVTKFLRGAANLLDTGGKLMIADLYSEGGLFHRHVHGFEGHNGFEPNALALQLEKVGMRVLSVKDYFSITKKIPSGEEKTFPLFFMVAEKPGAAT